MADREMVEMVRPPAACRGSGGWGRKRTARTVPASHPPLNPWAPCHPPVPLRAGGGRDTGGGGRGGRRVPGGGRPLWVRTHQGSRAAAAPGLRRGAALRRHPPSGALPAPVSRHHPAHQHFPTPTRPPPAAAPPHTPTWSCGRGARASLCAAAGCWLWCTPALHGSAAFRHLPVVTHRPCSLLPAAMPPPGAGARGAQRLHHERGGRLRPAAVPLRRGRVHRLLHWWVGGWVPGGWLGDGWWWVDE